MEDIINKIKKIIANDLFLDIPEDKISLDDSLQSGIGLDSLAFTELRFQCEQQFAIKINDDDFVPENFRTVRQLANLIGNIMAKEKNYA